MCTNYEPSLHQVHQDFAVAFGANLPTDIFKPETFPGYLAPVVRMAPPATPTEGRRECIAARFGLVPAWVKPADVALPRLKFATHNARVETASQLPSFKHAWRNRQFCLIPVKSFYEPCWETGRAVRWKISLADELPFALAGLWGQWRHEDKIIESFTMLTVNADTHPIMARMHRPGEEKRMPVILAAADYAAWLHADMDEARRLCQPFHASGMTAQAAPAVRRITAEHSTTSVK